MGKKKINIKYLFLLTFMLPNMYSHSQRLFKEELHWKQKKEVITELYKSMQNEVNDTTPVFVEYNKFDFFEMSLSDLFNRIFKRQIIDEQLTLQKRLRQNKTKNCLDSNFGFVDDSVVSFVFKNKSQIAEWGKNLELSPFMPFSIVHSTEFCIKDKNIHILMVHGCSGVHCIYFYVFKEKGDMWELQTTSQTILREQIKIRVDNDHEKIIFETESRKIGELLFEVIIDKPR